MDHFRYQDGELFAEDVAVKDIAAQVGTPFYCYSSGTFEHHFKVMQEALSNVNPLICFAVKSNSNFAVIKTLANLGAGADVVSEGEIRRVLKCGIAPEKIIFSGVGKTADEMKFALETGIFQFNVESEPELILLDKVAGELGKTAPVALRINPNVDAVTNAKITTGLKTSKFGIDIDYAPKVIELARSLENINLQGLSVHIGSQITDLEPFRKSYQRTKEFADEVGGIKILDLGGGLGVPYERDKVPPHPNDYAKIVEDIFGDTDYKLCFEPGRVIAANAGIMVSKVIYVKPTDERDFLIIDGAMNDLIRPSYYNAHHDALPVKESSDSESYDIVGPVCETGDTFAEQRPMPKLEEGDLVAFRTAGAYGAVMAGTYNSRPIIAEVMVKGDKFAVTSRRQTYDEMFDREELPEWL